MSGDVSMAMVIEALGEVYTDEGIAIWLSAERVSGRFEGRRPIDVCRTAEGRYDVWTWAAAATGMVAT